MSVKNTMASACTVLLVQWNNASVLTFFVRTSCKSLEIIRGFTHSVRNLACQISELKWCKIFNAQTTTFAK
jgi:hypothetical protein